MVAHNAGFDMSFIIENCKRLGIEQEFTYVDTVGLARMLLPGLNRFKLDTVAKALNISLLNHHRAVDDAACTAEIFVKFIKMCKERDIFDLNALNEAENSPSIPSKNCRPIMRLFWPPARLAVSICTVWCQNHTGVLQSAAEDPEECVSAIQRRTDDRICL